MPAADSCEPQIITAIQKAGYLLTHRQYAIRPSEYENFVYADLRFVGDGQKNRVIIVVEVKCFPASSALTEEFYQAIGQYMLYRNSLALANIEAELLLAVPLTFYIDFIMERRSAQATLKDARVNMIIVDLAVEEITSWITW